MYADYSAGGGGAATDYKQFQNPYEKKKKYEAQRIKPAKPAGVIVSFNTGVSWGLGFFGGSAYGIIDGLRTALSPMCTVDMYADYSAGGGGAASDYKDYKQFQNPYGKKKKYEAQRITPAKPAAVAPPVPMKDDSRLISSSVDCNR